MNQPHFEEAVGPIDAFGPKFTEQQDAQVKIAAKVAEAKRTDQAVRHRIDVASMDSIIAAEKDAIDKESAVETKIAGLMQRLAAPPPEQPEQLTYEPNELLSMAIAAAIGGGKNINDVLNAGAGIAGRRQEAEFKNALSAYGAERDAAEREYRTAEGDREAAEADARYWGRAKIQAQQSEEAYERQQADQDERTRLQNERDDRKYAEAEEKQKRTEGDRLLREFNDDVMELWTKADSIHPDDTAAYEKRADDIARVYSIDRGLFREVPTSKTLGKRRSEIQQEQFKERSVQRQKEFDERVRQFEVTGNRKDRQFAENQRRQWASLGEQKRQFEIRQQNGTLAPTDSDKVRRAALRSASGALRNAKAKLAELNARADSAKTDKERGDIEGRRVAVTETIKAWYSEAANVFPEGPERFYQVRELAIQHIQKNPAKRKAIAARFQQLTGVPLL